MKESGNGNDNLKAGFTAYPVPFKDVLTIRFDFDCSPDVKIEVFDSQGLLILSKIDENSYLNKEIKLNLNSNKGQEQVYVVKLTTNRESTVKKVMSSKKLKIMFVFYPISDFQCLDFFCFNPVLTGVILISQYLCKYNSIYFSINSAKRIILVWFLE